MDGYARTGVGRTRKGFEMISTEYRDKGQSLPADTTEILHA
jgi:hypothetical protein